MKVLSIVGARPQFVKLKPMSDALNSAGAEHTVVHTGQHYNANMSDAFFVGLNLPEPDVNLAIGSGSHGKQTGEMLTQLEPVIERFNPDWVLVYGDTNSTLAGALAAVKIHVPVAHIEAGLRSRNRAMPEEINRVMTDHASDLLFAPTEIAMENLRSEGLGERSHLVGDVMADLVKWALSSPEFKNIDFHSPAEYVVATIHRPSNTDQLPRLTNILSNLARMPIPTLLVVHPRLRAVSQAFGIDLEHGNIQLVEPLPYLHMLQLVSRSAGIITDSGGLQKEAFLLGIPCTTIRAETEWPETLVDAANCLDVNATLNYQEVIRPISRGSDQPFGDGSAAQRVAKCLIGLRS